MWSYVSDKVLDMTPKKIQEGEKISFTFKMKDPVLGKC